LSLRADPLAKGYAQMVLDFALSVSEDWIERYHLGTQA
jgi:hypothetical protein